jgi:hypothetical protein
VQKKFKEWRIEVMKLMRGAIVLACAPLAFAGNNGVYPTERVAAFVVQQLDVTTLPSELRPKREKGKKTLGEYGYVTRNAEETGSRVDLAQGTSQFTLTVLARTESGIFVCAKGHAQNASSTNFQRVLVLKRKDGNGLLKSRESGKEFEGCPAIGGESDSSRTSSYN